jgi:hypothetical protein
LPWLAQAELLTRWLTRREPEAIAAYGGIMDALLALSYDHRLWAAAYLINGGCADDCFDYFRGWLIAQGKRVFFEALRDPDTLAGVPSLDAVANTRHRHVACEAMLYVAAIAHEARTGTPLPPGRARRPRVPSGESWDEGAEEEVCPRLAAWLRGVRGW